MSPSLQIPPFPVLPLTLVSLDPYLPLNGVQMVPVMDNNLVVALSTTTILQDTVLISDS